MNLVNLHISFFISPRGTIKVPYNLIATSTIMQSIFSTPNSSPSSERGYEYYARNLPERVLNNFPKSHGDRMIGVVIHNGQNIHTLVFMQPMYRFKLKQNFSQNSSPSSGLITTCIHTLVRIYSQLSICIKMQSSRNFLFYRFFAKQMVLFNSYLRLRSSFVLLTCLIF